MNSETIIRTVAVLAAVAVVAPAVIAAAKAAAAPYLETGKAPAAAQRVTIADMRIVLDLADRLRRAGRADGVALCQQLLDVMLANPKPPAAL